MTTFGKYIAILSLFLSFSLRAQDTLTLSRQECETLFLKENLFLIAEKLHISQAEAIAMQARLWHNPSISIEEVNLWASQKNLAVFGDELQGINGGSFARNRQISVEIEQLVRTAGKRKKLMALEQVSVDKSKQYFEDLLRNLKTELRTLLTRLQYLQQSQTLYQTQISSVRTLAQACRKQSEQGNIPQSEYIRLKALELEITKKNNEVNRQINETQKELKLLMNLPPNTLLKISKDGYIKNTEPFHRLLLANLFEQAKEHRPDYKISLLEESYYKKLYTYEKAQRVPDITLKGGYDRGGNFMYNFVGFGVAMELPFYNRNQGNIQFAQAGTEQAKILTQQKKQSIENEIVLVYQNLSNCVTFWEAIDPEYEAVLDQLLESYTRNFMLKNLSMLEYLDFLDTYLENKIIILEAAKEINLTTEELNYTVGKDVM